jgi:hypothetical protein
MSKRVFGVAVALTCVLNAVVWGADHKKATATYVGGTVGLYSGLTGTLSTDANDLLTFKPDSRPLTLEISYKAITAIEYGPAAGQRVPVMVAVSKKNGHYLTVNWKDEADKEQSIVVELSRDIVGTTLATLEMKAGKAIQYQNTESRNASGASR